MYVHNIATQLLCIDVLPRNNTLHREATTEFTRFIQSRFQASNFVSRPRWFSGNGFIHWNAPSALIVSHPHHYESLCSGEDASYNKGTLVKITEQPGSLGSHHQSLSCCLSIPRNLLDWVFMWSSSTVHYLQNVVSNCFLVAVVL